MNNERWEKIKARLQKSKFRSGFKLKEKEREYFEDKGENIIRQHAYDFIADRLAPTNPKNDGKQTPMRGHPVFVAQHATATCCRGCLSKWHKIEAGRELRKEEVDYIVGIIMGWLNEQMSL
ncbi:MAG: DUF4186 domain-containing protein [Patescibacteria group bacterium]|nr:DUF4186 domain-containing protein [Patescibacteria group bacterium]MDD5295094.1 DUF4186 domain-containing protein [Patescibacteria group bacterium]MDD5554161.1 DUF4186 domain-containing protein [Patescibacteria group bacterium]